MTDATGRPPLTKRRAFWITIALSVLGAAIVSVLVVLSVTLGNAGGQPEAGGSASSPPIAPEVTPSPAAVVTPPADVATPEPTANADRIPHACGDIYTRDLTPDFHGLTLNPEWTSDPASWGGSYFDETIHDTATSQSAITCKWAAGGPTDRGLFTDVAYISPLQMNELPARLQQLGQTCYEELQGTRCVYETTKTADGNAGESHFFRDGIWIATHWINAGPDGYTHDIVAALFD